MTTNTAAFQQPKDPADVAWYAMTFPGLVLADSPAPAVSIVAGDNVRPPIYPTPGDDLPGSMLTQSSAQVVHASTGDGVAMVLSGGVPGTTYEVRVGVYLADGSLINRTADLVVTGL